MQFPLLICQVPGRSGTQITSFFNKIAPEKKKTMWHYHYIFVARIVQKSWFPIQCRSSYGDYWIAENQSSFHFTLGCIETQFCTLIGYALSPVTFNCVVLPRTQQIGVFNFVSNHLTLSKCKRVKNTTLYISSCPPYGSLKRVVVISLF